MLLNTFYEVIDYFQVLRFVGDLFVGPNTVLFTVCQSKCKGELIKSTPKQNLKAN